MSIVRFTRSALALLSRRDRLTLAFVAGIQMVLAFLDLLGVALLGVTAALATSTVSGVTPSLVQDLIDNFGLSNVDSLKLALYIALIAGSLLIVKSVFSFLLTRRSFKFLAHRQAKISAQLSAALLSKPLIYIQQRSSQELAFSLTAGVNAATLGVLGSGLVIVAESALVVVLSLGLLAIDVWIMIFTFLFFAIIGFILTKLLSSWATRLGRYSSEAEIESYTSLQEVLRTFREVSVTGRKSLYVSRFSQLRWNAARVQADIQIMNQVSKYVFEIALIVGGGLLAFSQLLNKNASAAVAVIAVFLAAASRMMPSLLRLQQASLTLKSAGGVASGLFEIAEELTQGSKIAPAPESIEAHRVFAGLTSGYAGFNAKVSLSGVKLAYPSSLKPALIDVTIDIPEGSSLAVVGSTGAGKSTLADVLLGILEPDFGTVTIGGFAPRRAVNDFPGAIAYVPQDISMVNGTVRENVALGIPSGEINDERVWESLRRAQLADLLESQRDGLETIVGEGGVRLSGGQRQRLGLARGLYSRPKLIVLDEATSALDAETEHAVSSALSQLEGNVTLVVIAHRLATVKHCHQIAYLESGQLVAIGTFNEVRNASPNFDRQANLLGL